LPYAWDLHVRSLPLAGHLSVSTENLEEAQATFSWLATPVQLQLLDRRAPFRWVSHRVKVGAVVLAAQEYGAAFRATSKDSPDMITASFPLSDVGGEARAGRESFLVARGRSTFVSCPPGARTFDLGTAYRGLQIMIDMPEMIAAVQALTGKAPSAPLRFEPRMALDVGAGAALSRLVAFMAQEIDLGGLVGSPIVGARISDAVLAQLLLGHPHNASRLFEAKVHPAEPRHVRRAAEYLAGNAGRPLRMAEIARAAGVSIRALQVAFLKYRGATPMQFLRQQRLEMARQLLSSRDARPAVREVARACGFAHLGRFGAQYFERFGEYPSATRARRC
jgi:AraC-like DNA-binding protein